MKTSFLRILFISILSLGLVYQANAQSKKSKGSVEQSSSKDDKEEEEVHTYLYYTVIELVGKPGAYDIQFKNESAENFKEQMTKNPELLEMRKMMAQTGSEFKTEVEFLNMMGNLNYDLIQIITDKTKTGYKKLYYFKTVLERKQMSEGEKKKAAQEKTKYTK